MTEDERIRAKLDELVLRREKVVAEYQEEMRDIATCQTCGGYGWLGDKCRATGACREFGSLYC